MKKIKIIILLFLFCIVFVFVWRYNAYLPTLDIKEKKVILEKSFFNSYNGFEYSGIVLCNDGTIYTWKSNDEISFSKNTSMKEKGSWIVENGELLNKKISKSKMKKIEKYISLLEDENNNSVLKSAEEGTLTIRVWDYDDSKFYILKETGGFETYNSNKYSKKLIEFVEKYLKD